MAGAENSGGERELDEVREETGSGASGAFAQMR